MNIYIYVMWPITSFSFLMITSKIFFKSWNGICMYKLKCQCFIYITFDRFDRTFVHYSSLKMEKKINFHQFHGKNRSYAFEWGFIHENQFPPDLEFFRETNFFLIKYLFLKLIGSRFLNWIILLKNDNEWSAKKKYFFDRTYFPFPILFSWKNTLKVPQLDLSDAEIFCHKNQSNCNLKLRNICTICIKKVNEWSAKKISSKKNLFSILFFELQKYFHCT